MHEFSVAQSIVDIALKACNENQAKDVKIVEVEIGQASGVEIEALEFAWVSVVKDTPLENAGLEILKIPLKVSCRNCKHIYSPEDIYVLCPRCSQIDPDIIRGKELKVVAIVI